MNYSLSVIIPVYRVENTLDECVRSVLYLCAPDTQVILVDDGSPDGCPQLCDAWAASDSRVEVIHRTNGGLSAARNSGLEVAHGEWVTFVDSDDAVSLPTVLPKTATEPETPEEIVDIVEYPVRRHYHSRRKRDKIVNWGIYSYYSAAEYWTATKGWEHSYAWNKIYRRTLFEGVRFPEGRVFEDIWTIPRLLVRARGIQTIKYGWYGYRDNYSGITWTAGGNDLIDLLEGNMEAVKTLGVDDARHYGSMVNIQIDVYRKTGRILLRPRRLSLKERKRLPWRLILKTMLPLRMLCAVFKVLNVRRIRNSGF